MVARSVDKVFRPKRLRHGLLFKVASQILIIQSPETVKCRAFLGAMSSQQWTWDSVPHYRLTQAIVDAYLKERFGNYSTFRTEVIHIDGLYRSKLIVCLVLQ